MDSSGGGLVKPSRRPDAAKRDAILDAAWSEFVAHGVDGASMEGVAAAARVSKVTAYRHFADKFALFEAVVRRRVDAMAARRHAIAPDGPIRDRLIAFGTALTGFVHSDELVRFDAMLRSEVIRVPGLARLFWEAGPSRAVSDLVALLEHSAAMGELAFDSAADAAEDLVGLWMGMSDKRRALGGFRGPADARVQRGVDLFLRLYGLSADVRA